jgi:hypothetical protein
MLNEIPGEAKSLAPKLLLRKVFLPEMASSAHQVGMTSTASRDKARSDNLAEKPERSPEP